MADAAVTDAFVDQLLGADRSADFERLVILARDDLAYHQAQLRGERERLRWAQVSVHHLQLHVHELEKRLEQATKLRETYLASRTADSAPR